MRLEGRNLGEHKMTFEIDSSLAKAHPPKAKESRDPLTSDLSEALLETRFKGTLTSTNGAPARTLGELI